MQIKKLINLKIILITICLLLCTNYTDASNNKDLLDATIKKAENHLLSKQKDDHSWWLPVHHGTHLLAHYLLFQKYLGFKVSGEIVERVKQIIYTQQTEFGGWEALYKKSQGIPDIDASILNYWFLKVHDEDTNSTLMKKARDYILSAGGVEEGNMVTKVTLALFNNMTWKIVPKISGRFFSDTAFNIIDYKNFAPWVTSAFSAIAYLRNHEVSKNLGQNYDLDELFIKKKLRPKRKKQKNKKISKGDLIIVKKIIKRPIRIWSMGNVISSYFVFNSLLRELHKYRSKRCYKN